jgi:hypothetical protein
MDYLSQCEAGLAVHGELFLDRPRAADQSEVHRPQEHLVPKYRYYEWRMAHKIRRPRGPMQYLRYMENQAKANGAQGFAFKLMTSQLHLKPELLLPLVARRYRFVHLIRPNLLDIVISREIARATGVAHTSSDQSTGTRPQIDPQKVKRSLEVERRRQKRARSMLRLLPTRYIELSYDDLVTDPFNAVSRIIALADLTMPASFSPETRLRRVNRGHQREKVGNYDEIVNVLRRTSYGQFLDDV